MQFCFAEQTLLIYELSRPPLRHDPILRQPPDVHRLIFPTNAQAQRPYERVVQRPMKIATIRGVKLLVSISKLHPGGN